MTEQVFSPLMLQRQMKDLQEKVGTIRTITFTVSSTVALLLAFAGLFAAYAPATLGVILGRMMDGGGYEMRLKRDQALATEPQTGSDRASPASSSSVLVGSSPAAGTAASSPPPARTSDRSLPASGAASKK
jgi:hypothetical protein